jgi:ribosome assembly protein YihI (activator of Der GTPase)
MADRYRLPDEKIAELQTQQRALADILPMIDDAETCGVECQEYRRVHREALDRINQLLDKFGRPNSKSI